MSTDVPTTDGEHRAKTDSASTELPAVTIAAEGVAKRRQQVGTDLLSCIETTPVQLAFTVTLDSQSQWNNLVNPTFGANYRTIKRGNFVDRLLEKLDRGAVYERQSSGTTNAPKWDLTIEATAPEWKRRMMEHIVSNNRAGGNQAYQAVSNLRQLLSSEFATAGAALAALDLVEEYDLDTPTDAFYEHIEAIPGNGD